MAFPKTSKENRDPAETTLSPCSREVRLSGEAGPRLILKLLGVSKVYRIISIQTENHMGIQDRDYMRERTRDRIAERRSKLNDKAKIHIALFITGFPIVIFAHGAAEAWGWKLVTIIGLFWAAVSLLVSRYVFGRSWHSIMWGDRK